MEIDGGWPMVIAYLLLYHLQVIQIKYLDLWMMELVGKNHAIVLQIECGDKLHLEKEHLLVWHFNPKQIMIEL